MTSSLTMGRKHGTTSYGSGRALIFIFDNFLVCVCGWHKWIMKLNVVVSIVNDSATAWWMNMCLAEEKSVKKQVIQVIKMTRSLQQLIFGRDIFSTFVIEFLVII